MYCIAIVVNSQRWEGVGTEASQILSSCYYVYKQLLQKDIQNLEMLDIQNQSFKCPNIIADLAVSFPDLRGRLQNSFPDLLIILD